MSLFHIKGTPPGCRRSCCAGATSGTSAPSSARGGAACWWRRASRAPWVSAHRPARHRPPKQNPPGMITGTVWSDHPRGAFSFWDHGHARLPTCNTGGLSRLLLHFLGGGLQLGKSFEKRGTTAVTQRAHQKVAGAHMERAAPDRTNLWRMPPATGRHTCVGALGHALV